MTRCNSCYQYNVQLAPRVVNQLAKQQFELSNNAPEGVKFYQNPDGDITDIQADIYGPGKLLATSFSLVVGTPYEGGTFRCRIVLQDNFPANPPKGYFLTKIFHPNVAQPSGDICVNTLKKDWNPAKWNLGHILEVIKCLLIVPFPESSLNEEAGRQFMEDYQQY